MSKLRGLSKPYYDSRYVQAHGEVAACVYLMNEAPGHSEACVGIPSFGLQGANIFHALRKANVRWAKQFEQIVWPQTSIDKSSKNDNNRYHVKVKFLAMRSQHITISNSYPYWPKSNPDAFDFQDPNSDDVVSDWNLGRIRNEIHKNHRALLLCGEYAYLASYGSKLINPAIREATLLTEQEIDQINCRLKSSFAIGWYMGHTRRWSLNSTRTNLVIQNVAKNVGWEVG